jgi:hypothetical protein
VRAAYEYAILRVVPDVAREEFVNAGVLFFCEDRGVLGARVELDEPRLRVLAPNADIELVRGHLSALARVCKGKDAGPIGELPLRERWRWLVAPRSTILQTSPPHGGVTDDLDAVVERLLQTMVRCPQ